jgi:long-subunit acyl-CoA synthetase (AMP-forming)
MAGLDIADLPQGFVPAGISSRRAAWPATVSTALVATLDVLADQVALRWRTPERWDSWTWADYTERVARVAAGLRELGVERGERVVLMTRNRPEFHVTDTAAVLIGAVPVSLYNSSSAERVRYVAGHAEAVVAVVESPEYLERFLKVRDELPWLRHLVIVSDIETALRGAPLISQACVAGDRRPYLVALLTIDPDALRAWARQQGLRVAPTIELLRVPGLETEVRQEVAKVNRGFSRVEQVKRFAMLDHEWSVDSEELTATMKVKRNRVLAKYAAQIDALYQ